MPGYAADLLTGADLDNVEDEDADSDRSHTDDSASSDSMSNQDDALNDLEQEDEDGANDDVATSKGKYKWREDKDLLPTEDK